MNVPVITPGQISQQQADALNDALFRLNDMWRRLQPNVQPAPVFEKFIVQVTAVDSSDPPNYSATEQWYDPSTSEYIVKPASPRILGPTIGTDNVNTGPLRERNNQVADSFPFYAEVTRRILISGVPYYEFDLPGFENEQLIQVTSTTPTSGFYPAVLCTEDPDTGDITASTTVCYYSNANGTVPILNQYYWTTLVGYNSSLGADVYGSDEIYEGVEINTGTPNYEPILNLIAGTHVTLALADNFSNRSTDVTINASTSGTSIDIGTILDPSTTTFATGPFTIVDGIAVATGVKHSGVDYTTGLFVNATGGPTNYRVLGMNECTGTQGGSIICDTVTYQILGSGDKAANGGLVASQSFATSTGTYTPNGISTTNVYFSDGGTTDYVITNADPGNLVISCLTGTGAGNAIPPSAPAYTGWSPGYFLFECVPASGGTIFQTGLVSTGPPNGSNMSATITMTTTPSANSSGSPGTITTWNTFYVNAGITTPSTNTSCSLGLNVFALGCDGTSFSAPLSAPAYCISASAGPAQIGLWDTDALGNTFCGGICTTVANAAAFQAGIPAGGGAPGSVEAAITAIWNQLNSGVCAAPW
jgi:hypothetical protein